MMFNTNPPTSEADRLRAAGRYVVLYKRPYKLPGDTEGTMTTVLYGDYATRPEAEAGVTTLRKAYYYKPSHTIELLEPTAEATEPLPVSAADVAEALQLAIQVQQASRERQMTARQVRELADQAEQLVAIADRLDEVAVPWRGHAAATHKALEQLLEGKPAGIVLRAKADLMLIGVEAMVRLHGKAGGQEVRRA